MPQLESLHATAAEPRYHGALCTWQATRAATRKPVGCNEDCAAKIKKQNNNNKVFILHEIRGVSREIIVYSVTVEVKAGWKPRSAGCPFIMT